MIMLSAWIKLHYPLLPTKTDLNEAIEQDEKSHMFAMLL
jgi:hypothetical protein